MSDADSVPEATPFVAPSTGGGMFGWTVTSSVKPRYVLTGPDSPALSTLLMILVMTGARVEMKKPRSRYIVTGNTKTMENLVTLVAKEPGAAEAGFSLMLETEPPDVPQFQSEPIRSAGYRRVSEVQGTSAQVREYVARAIDYRLYPSLVGVGRFTVTGSTERQMRWAAEVVLRKPLDETMQLLGVTKGMVVREDRDGQVFAMDTLGRTTRTTVFRDDEGELASSITRDVDSVDDDGTQP
jgi:hypothetical protein